MPGQRIMVASVVITVVAVVTGLSVLIGRERPLEPELGPVVQVHVRTATIAPTPVAAREKPSLNTPSASTRTPRVAPRSQTASVPSLGAVVVPPRAPEPAGDDDNDGVVEPDDDDGVEGPDDNVDE